MHRREGAQHGLLTTLALLARRLVVARLARELGAMEQTDEKAALAKILEILNKAWPIHNKAKEAVVA